ncbi:MAG: DUF6298 domain-containing protein [Mangrovibacterium sp.]
MNKICSILVLLLIGMTFHAEAKKKEAPIPPLQYKEGKLIYTTDEQGNKIPDFSYSGYKASAECIPFVPNKLVLQASGSDDSQNIQNAIDYLSTLPIGADGFRGAILLESGEYHLSDRLLINHSGIVIRGAGNTPDGTTLIADGTSRETLFRIEGEAVSLVEKKLQVQGEYVPVGTMKITLDDVSSLKVGDKIALSRPVTQEWIDKVGMSDFGGESSWWGWKSQFQFIRWDRSIAAINGNEITIDAPITTAIEKEFGGAFVQKYEQDTRISNVAVENLNIISAYDSTNLKDEEHCWNGISFQHVENAWVRRVNFKHLAGSAVALYEGASKVTVEDCISTEPISEIGGLRRYTFYTEGQQALFLRVYAEKGYHDFGTGAFVAGPTAFVQCTSEQAYSFSGTVNSWASGILFDLVHVDRQALSLSNRYISDFGAGWTAANCLIWQSTASMIENFAPPGANNWAFGTWAQFSGSGYWNFCNEHVNPRSLFFQQLAERVGEENTPKNSVIVYPGEPTSSPTPEQAKALMDYAMKPAITLPEFIAQHVVDNPISLDKSGAKDFAKIKYKVKDEKKKQAPQMRVNEHGWLVRGDEVLTGKQEVVPWWNGGPRPRDVQRAKPALTRYFPGKQGTGYTDKLTDVVDYMKENNLVAMEQHYALWYDRRRDDHERTNRINGEVWAPFLELPFERSGEGLAWDGLSKYDLTKYNKWYWGRLKDFADLADENGLVLMHQNYFQHNILEAGAHWVDSPWRPTNNINDTQFPEPVPFAGDKRVFMDRHFYDETNAARRPLHEAFIKQCFNNFSDNNGVIQMISAEYTGPLHFMEFWLDVVADWEKETGKRELIALSATKDVQDAILADTKRSALVDIIDIRYWGSRVDGTVWEPQSDMHLAPRQHMRINKTGKKSFHTIYQDVLSYRLANPSKAVMNSFDQSEGSAWAIFMAGGSLAGVPRVESADFLKVAAQCEPVESKEEGVYMLKSSGNDYIVYLDSGKQCELNLNGEKYALEMINPVDGSKIAADIHLKSYKNYTLSAVDNKKVIYLLRKR